MIFTEEDYRNSTQTSSPFICALEGILVPYVTFLILFKSGRMGAYRFYILNNVLTCFVLTVLCSVLNYTALFPSACFLLRPIVPITNMTAKYVVVLVMIGVVFMDMSEVWSLINRFAHAHPTIHDFLYRKHNTAYIVFMASTNIILALGLNLPFYFGSPDNEQDMIREVHRQLPNFNLTGRAVFCFYATQNSRYGLMFMIANLFGFLTFGIVCFIRLFWVIYGNKQSTLKIAKTLSLQKMLFKAFAVQLTIAFALLLLPLVVYLGVYAFEWERGYNIASFCIFLMTINGLLQNIALMYFVTPYRRAVLEMIGIKKRKVILVRTSSHVTEINK